MLQNKVVVVVLFSIVALLFARYFCRYYITNPAREAAKTVRTLEQARAYHLQQPAGPIFPPMGPMGELYLRYVLQGDEQAKQQLIAERKEFARRKHRTMIVISLIVACISALIAVGAGLTMRQARG